MALSSCLALHPRCFITHTRGAAQTVLEQGGSFAGVNRKVQLKPLRWSAPEEGSSEQPKVVEALLILKHGGVLTHAGRQQVRGFRSYGGFSLGLDCGRA